MTEKTYAAQVVKKLTDQRVKENVEAIKARNRQRNLEQYGCSNCPAAKCPVSCPRYLINAEPEILFNWWTKTSPPDNRAVEVRPSGPPAKGGGSKSGKRRKKPPPKMERPYYLA